MLAQRYYFRLTASLRKRSDTSLAQWSVIAVLAGSLRGCQPANDTRRSDIILGKIETLRSFLGGRLAVECILYQIWETNANGELKQLLADCAPRVIWHVHSSYPCVNYHRKCHSVTEHQSLDGSAGTMILSSRCNSQGSRGGR